MLDTDSIADIEGDADMMLRSAGLETDEAPDLRALCVSLTGEPPELARIRHESELASVNGSWRVFVRRGLLRGRARWLVGHELAELWHRRRGYQGGDIEARCDAMGAALAVPRAAYLRALREVGDDLRRLARALDTTESVIALRDGEARGRPVALLRPGGTIVRGIDYGWPRDLERRHAALVRTKIKDEPGRVAVRARVA